MKKTISILAVILSIMMLITSCGGRDSKTASTPAPSTPNPELVKNKVSATIEFEDYDDITVELYPDLAPETVENFVSLAEDGFYDGTIFHRVIEDFMIQGGGYDQNLKEKKADEIKGEFAANGFENTLSHTRGVISMARAQDMDSASSQFFIVQKDATYLDGQYAAFGKVTEGIEVVDEIASVRTGTVAASGMEDVPVNAIVIKSITIDSGDSSSKKSAKKSSSDDDDKDSDNDDDEDAKTTAKPKTTTKPKTTPKTGSSSSDNSNSLDEDDIAKIFEQENGSV